MSRSPASFSARPATRRDHDRLVPMMVALYVEDPSPHAVGPAKARRTLERLRAEPVRGRVILLQRDKKPAGYAILCSFWSNELGGEVCVVDELFVAPDARGGGLGAWFLGALVGGKLPFFADAVAYELEVTPDNTRARRLYKRLGFEVKKNAGLRHPGRTRRKA